jgi:site-specific recombinase XerD
MVKREVPAPACHSPVHFHIVRHACGFALVNKGHDTRSLQGLP